MLVNKEYKDSGISWIGNIPAKWGIDKIGSVYIERRTIVSDEEYEPLSVTKTGIVPQLDNAAKSDAHDNRKLVVAGDFVINSRSDRKGSSGISNLDGSVSLINTVLEPRANMNNKYYNFVFKTDMFCDEFYKWGHGIVADLWTTRWTDMKNIYVPRPDLSEQKAIADYLDKECARIDDIVEKQRNIIEKLKEYKKSVITEAVTRGLNPTAPMKDSGIEWIGKIPEQWQIKKLKYVLYQRNEKISDVSLKYIGLENIISFSNKYMNTNNISEPSSMNNICKKGDILFGKLRPYLAKCIISDFDGMCSGEFLVLYNCRGVVSYYHYLLLSHWFLDMVNSSTYGTKMPRANWDFIGSMFLPEPNIKEQRAIADYLDQKCAEIDSVVEKRERMIDLLAEYKKSLIYECVTGKKEVA